MLLRLKQIGILARSTRHNAFATQTVTEGVQRVSAAAHTPQQLEDNISELELMLADPEIQANQSLWDTNQASIKTLHSFLKAYTGRLSQVGGETEYLERQRHTLEFIVRDTKSSGSLKRVVCKIGTTGGDCHRLVHRTLQGLFREVGLSPNIVWDKGFAVREEHLTSEQRAQLEDAKLEAIKDQIVAAQQGKAPPANSPLKVANPDDLIGNTLVPSPAAAAPAASASSSESESQASEGAAGGEVHEDDMEIEDDSEANMQRIKALEAVCNQLAMTPWAQVHSAQLKEEEEKSAQDIFMQFMAIGGLNLRPVAEKIWAGERDADVLFDEFSVDDESPNYLPSEVVLQLVDCTRRIEKEFGPPDEQNPAPLGKLNAIARSIHHLTVAIEDYE